MLKNCWQLAIARHQELDGDQIDDSGIDRRKQEQGEHDADRDAESMPDDGAKRATDENFAHVTKHVIAHPFRVRRVDVSVGDL